MVQIIRLNYGFSTVMFKNRPNDFRVQGHEEIFTSKFYYSDLCSTLTSDFLFVSITDSLKVNILFSFSAFIFAAFGFFLLFTCIMLFG